MQGIEIVTAKRKFFPKPAPVEAPSDPWNTKFQPNVISLEANIGKAQKTQTFVDASTNIEEKLKSYQEQYTKMTT
jgi:hypothetical protein